MEFELASRNFWANIHYTTKHTSGFLKTIAISLYYFIWPNYICCHNSNSYGRLSSAIQTTSYRLQRRLPHLCMKPACDLRPYRSQVVCYVVKQGIMTRLQLLTTFLNIVFAFCVGRLWLVLLVKEKHANKLT